MDAISSYIKNSRDNALQLRLEETICEKTSGKQKLGCLKYRHIILDPFSFILALYVFWAIIPISLILSSKLAQSIVEIWGGEVR